MAKLIYSMLTSLDGYTEDEHGDFRGEARRAGVISGADEAIREHAGWVNGPRGG